LEQNAAVVALPVVDLDLMEMQHSGSGKQDRVHLSGQPIEVQISQGDNVAGGRGDTNPETFVPPDTVTLPMADSH
jgi:hypothetical protein